MQWLRMSKAERNAMKYAPELMYRMEDNIVSLCVKWVTDRLRLISDAESNASETLCNVRIDGDILIHGLVILTKARTTGLLYFKDSERSENHGIREEEMPAYWRWKVTETWSLAIEDLPAESMATHMVAFLKERYKGVFESSKRDREQLSEWFRAMWRSLRGHNVQSGQNYRDRSKKLKDKVEECCDVLSRTVTDVKRIVVEVEELRKEVSTLKNEVCCLECENKRDDSKSVESSSKRHKPYSLTGIR